MKVTFWWPAGLYVYPGRKLVLRNLAIFVCCLDLAALKVVRAFYYLKWTKKT